MAVPARANNVKARPKPGFGLSLRIKSRPSLLLLAERMGPRW